VLAKILRKPALKTSLDFSVLYYIENLARWCRQVASPTWPNTSKFFALQGMVRQRPGYPSIQPTEVFSEAAEQYFKDHPSDILVWRSRATLENYIFEHAPWHLYDGTHLTDSAYDVELQLLLNFLIN
jgi:hypothetical protein